MPSSTYKCMSVYLPYDCLFQRAILVVCLLPACVMFLLEGVPFRQFPLHQHLLDLANPLPVAKSLNSLPRFTSDDKLVGFQFVSASWNCSQAIMSPCSMTHLFSSSWLHLSLCLQSNDQSDRDHISGPVTVKALAWRTKWSS